MLTDSILVTVRALCNVEHDDQGFDKQLLPLINAQIMMAHEFGIGYSGFMVHDESETWKDLLGDHADLLNAVQTWLGYSVLLLFDPPDNGTILKSYQDQILKMEWMLCNKSCLEGYVDTYTKTIEPVAPDTPDEPSEEEEEETPDED